MSLIKKIKNLMTSPELVQGTAGSTEERSGAPVSIPGTFPVRPDSGMPELAEDPRPAAEDETASGTPAERVTIQAPILSDACTVPESDQILIQAQPSPNQDQCVFRVNRTLLGGNSWFFPDFESAVGSPLAEALFSLDDVETVMVLENTLTITRKDKTQYDWKPLGKEVGAAVRKVLQEGGGPLIGEKILREMPSEEMIRLEIQKVLDNEVNPGVAGHGGRITLLDVTGNTVTIQMGGGCQGCSAADLTLKQGIHTAFRSAVPAVGAILDETDHSAGLNPYFS